MFAYLTSDRDNLPHPKLHTFLVADFKANYHSFLLYSTSY